MGERVNGRGDCVYERVIVRHSTSNHYTNAVHKPFRTRPTDVTQRSREVHIVTLILRMLISDSDTFSMAEGKKRVMVSRTDP